MSDKLRDFVNKNKKSFDTEEPSKDLWEKINAKTEVKSSTSINSKWFSKLKYFGLGASMLIIAAYFITQNLNDSSSHELAQNTKDSAMNNLGQWVKTNQNKTVVNETEQNVSNTENEKNTTGKKNAVTSGEESVNQVNGKEEPKDTVNKNVVSEIGTDHSVSKETEKTNSVPAKEEAVSSVRIRKEKISAPSEPEKINAYNTSVYESSSLCEVLRIYKFPGQVSMDESGNYQSHRIMKTISCSKLENTPNMKAVWVKGKTGKKMTISVKEGLKNIFLVKSDGRKINPQAISHYYPGLGVISDYTGKYFEMTFKDKVDLILFFKDVEEGDKIIIDETIETVVKN